MAQTPPKPHTPPTPAQITTEIFKLFDANSDGSITLSEIESAITAHSHGHTLTSAQTTKLQSFFAALDANHDGKLSTTEVTTAVTAAHAAHHAPPHLVGLVAAALHHDHVI